MNKIYKGILVALSVSLASHSSSVCFFRSQPRTWGVRVKLGLNTLGKKIKSSTWGIGKKYPKLSIGLLGAATIGVLGYLGYKYFDKYLSEQIKDRINNLFRRRNDQDVQDEGATFNFENADPTPLNSESDAEFFPYVSALDVGDSGVDGDSDNNNAFKDSNFDDDSDEEEAEEEKERDSDTKEEEVPEAEIDWRTRIKHEKLPDSGETGVFYDSCANVGNMLQHFPMPH